MAAQPPAVLADLPGALGPWPSTPAAHAAVGLITACGRDHLLHHDLRNYSYARHLGETTDLIAGAHHDDELLFLSVVLDDLGLTDEADGSQRSEVDGVGRAARPGIGSDVFAARPGGVDAGLVTAAQRRYPRLDPVTRFHGDIAAPALDDPAELVPSSITEDAVRPTAPQRPVVGTAKLADAVDGEPAPGEPPTAAGHRHPYSSGSARA